MHLLKFFSDSLGETDQTTLGRNYSPLSDSVSSGLAIFITAISWPQVGRSRGGFLRSGILKQEREPGSSLRSSGFFSLSCVFVAATLENRSERRKFDSQSPSPRVAVGIWISVRNNLAILQNKYIKEYTKRSARKFLVQCRQIEVHQIDNQFIQPLKTSAKSQILRRVLFCFRHRFLSPSPLLFRRVWEKFGGKYLYRYIQIGQNFH